MGLGQECALHCGEVDFGLVECTVAHGGGGAVGCCEGELSLAVLFLGVGLAAILFGRATREGEKYGGNQEQSHVASV